MQPGSSIPPMVGQFPNQITLPTQNFNAKQAQAEVPPQPVYEGGLVGK